MTTRSGMIAGAAALAAVLGLATTALAKPDYLDRMNPRPKPPASQAASCDCPVMGAHGGACMAPTAPAPRGGPKG